jgi:hypothetical protein
MMKSARAGRRGAVEYLVSGFGFRVPRCQVCNLRFATLGGSMLTLMTAALVAVLGLVLWFSARQSAYAPDQSGAITAPKAAQAANQ